jgi:dihydroorotate dehydrogenase (NAD+) catalytic subunit
VRDVSAGVPGLPVIGVGGIASSWDAAELLLAGAVAVQVGTATFHDPRAPIRVLRGLPEPNRRSHRRDHIPSSRRRQR